MSRTALTVFGIGAAAAVALAAPRSAMPIPAAPAVASSTTAQACAPLPSGLTHWWRGDGTPTDAIGGDHGTPVGAVTYAPGFIGQAFQFGSGSLRLSQAYGGSATAEVTVMAWIQVQQEGPDPWQAIFSSADTSYVHFQTSTTGGSAIYTNPGSAGFHQITSFGPNPLGAWRHVALTAKSGEIRIYENGAVFNQVSSPFSYLTQNSAMQIGAGYLGARPFPGLVDELQVYGRALSQGEVQAVYSAGSAGFCGQAPGTWNGLNLPTARLGLAATTMNGRAYFIGGAYMAYDFHSIGQFGVTAVEAYDPAANTWAMLSPLPAGRVYPNGASVLNNRIYVPGGSGCDAPFCKEASTLFIFDPAVGPTGTWTSGPPMPVPIQGGSSVAIDGKLYVVAGWSVGAPRNYLFRFDPDTGVWTQLASLPGQHTFGASVALGGKLYATGGEGTTHRLDIYDPATDSWTAKTMPVGYQHHAAVAVGNRLILAGGSQFIGGSLASNRIVMAYDPQADAWTTPDPVPSPGGPYAGVVGIAMAFGGSATSTMAQLPLTLDLTAGTNVGTGLYVGGGCCGANSQALSTLFALNPANPQLLTYHWDFGDGAQATGPNPNHAYSAGGVYTVTLTVSTPDGRSGTATATVTVTNSAPPNPRTYTYIGNPLGNCTGTYVGCGPETRVSGWITVAQPLAANLSQADVNPTAFMFTDGRAATLRSSDTLAVRSFRVSTDAQGDIRHWTIVLSVNVDPAGCVNPNTFLNTYSNEFTGQSGDASCYLVNQGLPNQSWGAAQNHNTPGSWQGLLQSITFTSIPPHPATVGGTYAVTAIGGGSGNPVTFGSLTPQVCAVTGNVASLIAAGNCAIAANQAGSGGYGSAPQVMQVFVVSSATAILQVSAGGYSSCALKADGSVSCWGHPPFATVPASASAVSQVSVGYSHTCAVKQDGSVVCWGDDSYGQSTPPAGLGAVASVSAGGYHTCAVLMNGTTTCWGYNSFGQASVPANLTGVLQSSAGLFHGCALKSDGTVTCWGLNNGGQATPPTGLNGVTAVSAGGSHSCALRSDGSTECWGYDANSQVSAATFTSATSVSAGGFHTCGLLSDMTVRCVGGNGYHQEVVPAGLQAIQGVSAGYGHSCALKSDGKVACWGDNFFGQSTPPPDINGNVASVLQSIVFTSTPPSPAHVGGTYLVTATGGASGNQVTFSSLTPSVCSLAGNTVTFVTVGTCTIAADQAGGGIYLPAPRATQSFQVTSSVSITVPANIIVEAFSPAGTSVTFTATASDPFDASPSVSCAPASGATFPLGTTTVACTATNSFGNTATGSFAVVVRDTFAPVIQALQAPHVDWILTQTTETVTIRVADTTGVDHVSANNVQLTRTSGTSTDGIWQGVIAVTPFATLTINAAASDTSQNTAVRSFVVDNDGIAAIIDRLRTNPAVLQSNVFSRDFNDGVTSGTVEGGPIVFVQPQIGTPWIRLARSPYNQTSNPSSRISVCGGAIKHVYLDAVSEIADVRCTTGPNTLSVKAVQAYPTITVYKFLPNGSYRLAITLTAGQSASTGSPVSADPDNTEPIQVAIVRIDANGVEQVIGSYELDPGEIADVEVVPGATPADDQVVFSVLEGEVTVTLGAEVVTVGEGETVTSRVEQFAQSITLDAIPNKLFGDPAFAVTATASSGLPVTYLVTGACTLNGTVVTPVGTGSCTVTAAQTGDLNYLPASPVSRTFNVWHSWSGLLQPVNADGTSVFKLGSTVPLKFRLTGGSAAVTNLSARVYVAKVSNSVTGTEVEASATGSADAGNTFRYDAPSGQYIFNWGTKNLSEGTWQIRVDLLDDNASRTVLVSLRK